MDLTCYKCDYEPCGKVTTDTVLEDSWIEIRGGKGNTITLYKQDGQLHISSNQPYEKKEPVVHFCCFDCLKSWFESLRPLIQLGKKEEA